MRPIVIDGGESKKTLSMDSGAEHFVDFKEEKDVVAKVVEICDGLGAHGVLVTAWQAYNRRFPFHVRRVQMLMSVQRLWILLATEKEAE